MSALTLLARDSNTMLRRNLLHVRRYPSLTLNLLLTPVMMLLLFVYVFGDVMSAGIGSGGADRSDYVAYIVPGILLMTIGSTVIGAAVSVATDMNEGIIARFRTMAIHRGSVLVGHVAGSVLQVLASLVLVGAVGVAIGFRSSDATALEWLAAFGLLALFALALTWIAVGMGLASPNAEAASNMAMPLILLPSSPVPSSPPTPCPAGSGRSPSTSLSPRSSKPSAACFSAARSATTAGSRSRGAWLCPPSATSGRRRSSTATRGSSLTAPTRSCGNAPSRGERAGAERHTEQGRILGIATARVQAADARSAVPGVDSAGPLPGPARVCPGPRGRRLVTPQPGKQKDPGRTGSLLLLVANRHAPLACTDGPRRTWSIPARPRSLPRIPLENGVYDGAALAHCAAERRDGAH